MSSLRVVAISEMKRKGFSGKDSQEIPRQNYLFVTEQIILYRRVPYVLYSKRSLDPISDKYDTVF